MRYTDHIRWRSWALLLGVMVFASSLPLAWSQEDELELEAEPGAVKTLPADDQPTEEDGLSLEPLQGNEEQTTEVPLEPPPEVTPEALTPKAPGTPEEPQTFTSVPEPGLNQDQPDLAYEARLYDIYLNYHSKKMSDDEWSALIGARESEVLNIEKGDTLWGISKLLFNDGNYWPKIWQLNNRISNPHLISPGNDIRFLLGTESDAPAFTVTEKETPAVEEPPAPAPEVVPAPPSETQVVDQSAQLPTGATPGQEVEIPPPLEVLPPVLRKIPPSLPEWSYQRRSSEYDDIGIDYGRRPIRDLKERLTLEGFVDEDEITWDGLVSEIEGGAKSAAHYQYVYVTLPAGEGQAGQIYTAVRRLGPVVESSPFAPVRYPGAQYRILGEIRLEEKLATIGTTKSREVYRGFVTRAIFHIEEKDSVLKGPLPEVDLSSEGTRSNVVSQIIGGSLMSKQRTLGLNSLAFLMGGSNIGLAEGQTLTVRANTRFRNPKSLIKESYIPVGQLKVVRVTPRFATAIVTKVWDTILVGDVTGEGRVLPPDEKNIRKAVTLDAAPEKSR